ncbi:cytochrome c6, chloroplastic [Aristolochia californica]|uniref:cytochrome c6, chloroplastic n=1 Tax=Aristolochia californica TaxID=171875 RepID=UPI0035DC461D
MQCFTVIFPCRSSPFASRKHLSSQALFKEDDPFQRQQEKSSFLKCLATPLVATVITLSSFCSTPVSLAQVTDPQREAELFNKACIGCHVAGGNIIQPGATLFLKDLQRNGVDSEEGIYGITYYGKGRMPGFGVNCTPRGQCTFGARLQDEEIKLLAEFVKSQADKGWPDIESYGD